MLTSAGQSGGGASAAPSPGAGPARLTSPPGTAAPPGPAPAGALPERTDRSAPAATRGRSAAPRSRPGPRWEAGAGAPNLPRKEGGGGP